MSEQLEPINKGDAAEMKAGRELDELIAVRLMGWERASVESVLSIKAYRRPNFDGLCFSVPNYSTDIADAWKVVEQMRAQFGSVLINCDEFTKGWAVEIAKESKHPTDFVKTDTVAIACAEEISLAICRAALAAATGDK